MDIAGKNIVVTGGGSGIGAALVRAFHAEGANHIAVADIGADASRQVALSLGVRASAWQVDVADETSVAAMIKDFKARVGDIDLYVSNAGILYTDGPDYTAISQTAEQWEQAWQVNVYAHIIALRHILPVMIQRGGCGFIITASAAGLLSQIGDTVYSTTKHAAVGLAETIAITHGDEGLYVGVICPQAVETAMIKGAEQTSAALDGIMDVDEMAAVALSQIKEGRFMIRPHTQVEDYFKAKAADYDRWVGGMRKLRRNQLERTGKPI